MKTKRDDVKIYGYKINTNAFKIKVIKKMKLN